ncbi:FAD-dependent oxidoreductase [Pseudomonas sp. C2L12B]|nr:FAD-dependent oxidoreductase [Pseudomonas typographi]
MKASPQWDDEVDLLVIGAGAAGMATALVATLQGLNVRLVEKSAQVGGTAATSAGTLWIPGNRQGIAAGYHDCVEDGRRYLRELAKYSEKADLRLRSDGRGPVLEADDPLGLLLTSHHTIVTADLPRAARLYTEILEGEPIATSVDPVTGAQSTYIRLADTLLEFVTPVADTALWARVAQGEDYYLGLTYLVNDTQAVGAHLDSVGVQYDTGRDGEVIIPPAAGFGVQWRFVQSLPYPAQARQLPAF